MYNDLLTKKDCCRDMYDKSVKSNVGCIAILKPEALDPKYRKAKYQLLRLEGGFGCSPTASGNGCVSTCCADGEVARWERHQFLGIANGDITKYAERLEEEVPKQELVKLMIANFTNEDGNLDLRKLDFSEFDGDIDMSEMKVKGDLRQGRHNVGGNLYQDNHDVEGDLHQSNHRVEGDLWQDCQRVKKNLFQHNQQTEGDLYDGNKSVTNMTKEELVKLMIKNFKNEYGDLDLSSLDFSKFDGNVNISRMKVKRDLYQDWQQVGNDLLQGNQKVGRGLWQNRQEVEGGLWQDGQKVGDDLWQNGQKVKGNLRQNEQQVKGDLWQNRQEVEGGLWQNGQKVKGHLYQFNQEVEGDLYDDNNRRNY